MTKSYFPQILAAFCCLILAMPIQAAVDAMQLRLLEPYSLALRWDNIETDDLEADSPYWIHGARPEYDDQWDMHRVSLISHQQITVYLPPYESLRLYHPNEVLTGQELEVYASNGTGLALQHKLQQSTDGHSLVLSPQLPIPLLIHLVNRCCRTDPLKLALFVSRKEPLKDMAPYRNLAWSEQPWQLLSQEPFTLPQVYKRLSPQQKQHYEISGPARVELKTRLDYELQTFDLAQHYHIRYWVDQNPAEEITITTSGEANRVVTINGKTAVVSREESAYFEIPPGPHDLVLEPDRPLYLQMLTQTEEDYLVPALNNPPLPVEKIRAQGVLPSTPLANQTELAERIAFDNHYREGGMAASQLLKTAALQRPDYPTGLIEADQLRNVSTFYRDLLPSKKISPDNQFLAYFLNPTLLPVKPPIRDTVLAEQHLIDALKRLGSGYFTALNPAEANQYTLPDQLTVGQIRLVVDKRHCTPGYLHIGINQDEAKRFWLRCQSDLANEDFERSLAETALLRLKQKPGNLNVSLEAPFTNHFEPAPIINAGIYELALPVGANSLKVWWEGPAKLPSPKVAIQYRAGKSWQMNEPEYLAELRQGDQSNVLDLFAKLLAESDSKGSLTPSDKLPSARRLYNEWVALKRLIISYSKLYASSINQQDNPISTTQIDSRFAEQEANLARQAESRQLWLEALEHWGKAANVSKGTIRQQAQLQQTQNLLQLNEDFLAENLLRYLILYGDPDIAKQASDKLKTKYLNQGNPLNLLALNATIFRQQPNEPHAQELFKALLQNGEYRYALLLGLTLKNPPISDLLTAAYRMEWWESYDQLEERLPSDQKPFWQGLKSQYFGDYVKAQQYWSQPSCKPWLDYLQQGVRLNEQLHYATSHNAEGLYKLWWQWQQSHPGPKIWQNALTTVKDYAGGDIQYAIERDLYSQAVRATPQRPVTLKVLGPTTLNLLIRPLHNSENPNLAFDGWLEILDNNAAFRYPYLSNTASQGLAIIGSGNPLPGGLVNLIYEVGSGWHELALYSQQTDLALTIQEQHPELPVKILPALTTDSFAEMGYLSRNNFKPDLLHKK